MQLTALKKMIRENDTFKELSNRTLKIIGYDLRDYVPCGNAMPFDDVPLESIYAGNEWDEWLQRIRTEWQRNPQFFLREPSVTITLHPNEQEMARLYLNEMKNDRFFLETLLPRIAESPFGNPYLCHFFPYASPQTMQHAYFFYMMKKRLGFFAPEELGHVTEIGGGYGNMFRLFTQYGYKDNYTIFDLEPMFDLQKHYIGNVSPGRKIPNTLKFESKIPGLAPTQGKKSLLMGTFSFTEMPLETRSQVESYFEQYDYLFIAYNKSFDGIDNHKYIEELKPRLSAKFEVQHFKDEHRSAWFVLAKKRA